MVKETEFKLIRNFPIFMSYFSVLFSSFSIKFPEFTGPVDENTYLCNKIASKVVKFKKLVIKLAIFMTMIKKLLEWKTFLI